MIKTQAISLLNRTVFASAFERFSTAILEESGAPFTDFGSGLAHQWEGYKEWIYHQGRCILAFDEWRESAIGSGEYLQKAINAIQIHQDARYRNNLVQWTGRYGSDSRAHKLMLEAQHDRTATTRIERVLFDFYMDAAEEERCFESLVNVVGKRYDLIAYLFFLKDWTRYMPIRTISFTESFEQLGIPLAMRAKCSWNNYTEYIIRLKAVQEELAEYSVPGVRLIDAHSFCWLLVNLPMHEGRAKGKVQYIRATPQSVNRVIVRSSVTAEGINRDYAALEAAKRRIGDLAQRCVVDAEKRRLREAGRSDLAENVQDVSSDASLGYDIHSFFDDASDKLIEVKAASVRSEVWRFFLSENERQKSRELPGYVFALVQNVESAEPVIWEFSAAQLPIEALHPVSYEVRIGIN